MTALPLSGLRLVATLPPRFDFWGANFDIAKSQISALRKTGATVYEFDTTPFYNKDLQALRQAIADVKSFNPEAAISSPNAGYIVQISLPNGSDLQNVFFDILKVPTILRWDHPLTQAPRYVSSQWPSSPLESTGGIIHRLRSLFTHPLVFHYFADTGFVAEIERLGIATFDRDCVNLGYVGPEFIEYGKAAGLPDQYKHEVGFVGNMRLTAARNIPYDDDTLIAVRDRALAATISDWDLPSYYAYRNELDALSAQQRLRLNIDVDQSFYWRYLEDEIGLVATGEPRFQKVRACGHRVTYFGGFADSESRKIAQEAGLTLADEYVPYGPSLAKAFRQMKISIDVSNAAFINGFTSKALASFGAGGFTLTSRKPDYAAFLGPISEAIAFSSASELAEKVDHYLTHDAQRREVANEIAEFVRRNCNATNLFARSVPMALDRIRARKGHPF